MSAKNSLPRDFAWYVFGLSMAGIVAWISRRSGS
jgi:hypothetical protein